MLEQEQFESVVRDLVTSENARQEFERDRPTFLSRFALKPEHQSLLLTLSLTALVVAINHVGRNHACPI